MNIQTCSLLLIFNVCLLFGGTNTSLAAPLHFRPETGGAVPSTNGTYTWDTTTGDWFATETGGTGQAWNNTTPDSGIFYWATTPYTVQLGADITTAGLSRFGGSSPSAGVVTFTSVNTSAKSTLTFAGGGGVSTAGRLFQFQDLTLTNFSVANSGNAILGSGLSFSTPVTTYAGELNVAANTTAEVEMSGGTLKLYASSGSIARLSGNGTIGRASAGANGVLTVNQADNTVFLGVLGSSDYSFAKANAGTLIISGAGSHTINRNLDVTGGALYMGGTIAGGASTYSHTISSGATYGGDFTTSKLMNLNAADSTLTPGMATLSGQTVENHAGTMVLGEGITGDAGGTFNFYLDENDGFGGLLNSRIDIIDGTVTLALTKTVNLFGLGAGLLQTGIAYTLFDADLASARTLGWDQGWSWNQNTTGLDVDTFGFVGNELQVVFAVPEPSTSVSIVLGLLGFAFLRTRRRIRSSVL